MAQQPLSPRHIQSPKHTEGDNTWIKIQKKTFGRWVHLHLSGRQMSLSDLGTELRDGVKLVNLLEQISGKKIIGYNKNPRMKIHCLENLVLALGFISDEGLRLVGIGPEDIYTDNLKLILGMVWTLILRYQINTQPGETQQTGSSPTAQLIAWLKDQYGLIVHNFNKDWANGNMLTDLLNAIQPGRLSPAAGATPVEKISAAMNAAEAHHDIPLLLDPEDMAHASDDLSVMTYISLFKKIGRDSSRDNSAKHPIKPIVSIKSANQKKNEGTQNHPSKAQVEINSSTPLGEGVVSGILVSPSGDRLPVEGKKALDGNYEFNFIPTEAGDYSLEVEIDGRKADGSVPVDVKPVSVRTRNQTADATLKKETKLSLNLEANIPIGSVSGTLVSPTGQRTPVRSTKNSDGTYGFNFTPQEAGDFVLEVEVDGTKVEGKVAVHVAPQAIPALDTSVNAVQKQPTRITIPNLQDLPNGADVSVTILSPRNERIHITPIKKADGNYEIPFTPQEAGNHRVEVEVDGDKVDGAIKLNVDAMKIAPINLNKTEAVQLQETKLSFPIDHSFAYDQATVTILSPRNERIVVKPEKSYLDGTQNFSFTPTEAGDYTVEIDLDGTKVQTASKLHVAPLSVKPINHSSTAFLDTLTLIPLPLDVSLGLSVDDIKVVCKSPTGKNVPVTVEQSRASGSSSESINFSFTPKEYGEYTFQASVGDRKLDGQGKILVVSPLIPPEEETIDTIQDKETTFAIPALLTNAELCDFDHFEAFIESPDGDHLEIEYSLNVDDEEIEITFTPTDKGKHQLKLTYHGKQIKTDTVIQVHPPIKPVNQELYGSIGKELKIDFPVVTLDGKSLPPAKVEAFWVDGKKKKIPLTLKNHKINQFTTSYVPTQSGPQGVEIFVHGHKVKGKLNVTVTPKFHTLNEKIQVPLSPDHPFAYDIPLRTEDGSEVACDKVKATLVQDKVKIPLEVKTTFDAKLNVMLAPPTVGNWRVDVEAYDEKVGEIHVSCVDVDLKSAAPEFQPVNLKTQANTAEESDLVIPLTSKNGVPFHQVEAFLVSESGVKEKIKVVNSALFDNTQQKGKISGKHQLSWMGGKPGKYTIQVYGDGVLVPGKIEIDTKASTAFESYDNRSLKFTAPPVTPRDAPIPKKTNGFLAVTVHKAINLRAADGSAKRNPYVELTSTDRKRVHKTRVIPNSLFPTWDQNFEIVLDERHQLPTILTFAVKDQDDTSPELLGNCSCKIPSGFDKEEYKIPIMYKGDQEGEMLVTVEWRKRYHVGGPGEVTWYDSTTEWCPKKFTDPSRLEFKPSGWELIFEVNSHGVVSGSNKNLGETMLKHNRGSFINGEIKLKVLIENSADLANSQRNVYIGKIQGNKAYITIYLEKSLPGVKEVVGDWRCARGNVYEDFQHPKEKAERHDRAPPIDMFQVGSRITKPKGAAKINPLNLLSPRGGGKKDKDDQSKSPSPRDKKASKSSPRKPEKVLSPKDKK